MLYRVSKKVIKRWGDTIPGWKEWRPARYEFEEEVTIENDDVLVGMAEENSFTYGSEEVIRVLHPEHGLLWVYRADLAQISKK